LQIALECSDGAGNVLMKKVQAEPAPEETRLRWIVSGKTVFNNKGRPVKQYEPYFSDDFGCTEADQVGVTPIMYYDAADRLIRTELPDGTFRRVEFSPWDVKTFDANDTVRDSAWYAARGSPDPSQPLPSSASAETRTAWLAAHYAETPGLTILDSLGRDVVAITHNRTPNISGQWRDEYYVTFTKLDAEGKPLWIQDPRGNLVMRYTVPASAGAVPTVNFYPAYDIAGNLLYQHSMDGGDRWMMMDAAGKPMLAWDFNQRQDSSGMVNERRLYFTAYDSLHRPAAQWLTLLSGTASVVESFLVERFEHLDTASFVNPATGVMDTAGLANARRLNLLGQIIQHWDAAGLTTVERVDFKGNIEEIRRRLNNTPQASRISWHGNNPAAKLEPQSKSFVQMTEYDALNRMTRRYNWHRLGQTAALYQPKYNKRGLLISEKLLLHTVRTPSGPSGGLNPTGPDAIREIRYDVRGQKAYLRLGNGTLTQYDYDPLTFRLRQIRTTRVADPTDFPQGHANLTDANVIQQLHYTFDAMGNITEIYDEAYETVFFNNQRVEPRSRYVYDAIYRLIEATGRENITANTAPNPLEDDPLGTAAFPVNNQALRNYTQRYRYDDTGNILEMRHWAGSGNLSERWTRHYEMYADSNRLHYTWTGSNRAATEIEYHYDTHGNMLNLAKVALGQFLRWDYRDMIGRVNPGSSWIYYQYDAGKQRTRKQVERTNSSNVKVIEERIYLGGYEYYSRTMGSTVVEEIESHHVFEGDERVLMVDDVLKTNRRHADGRAYKIGPIYRYQYSNHLGSACVELDEGAQIISYEEYHPYGTSAYRLVKNGLEAPPKRYRYTGMERDEETGLNYHGARYYALWLGRWVSTDPGGLIDGTNLYAYVNNRPTHMSDRSGTIGSQLQAGKDWEAKVLTETMAGHEIVQQVTVTVTENNKEITSVLDALARTKEGFVVLETKLNPTTELSEAQQAVKRVVKAGGKFKISASDPAKIEELGKVLGLSSGAEVTASKQYRIIHQGNVTDVLRSLEVIGPDEITVITKSGSLQVVSKSEAEAIYKIAAKNQGMEWEQAAKVFREQVAEEAPALANAGRKVAAESVAAADLPKPSSGGIRGPGGHVDIRMLLYINNIVKEFVLYQATLSVLPEEVKSDKKSMEMIENELLILGFSGAPSWVWLLIAAETRVVYETVERPMIEEFYKQYPSPVNFFNQVYAQ